MTIPELFATAAGADPARPFLTYYDDATGERIELSYLTLANWANKTANLLVDGLGLETGAVAAVDMPAHWLTAALLTGCWSAGLAIAHEPSDVDVAFVGEDRLDSAPQAPDVYGVGLRPMALRLAEERAGVVDFLTEVRTFGDHFRPMSPVPGDAPALVALPRGGQRTQDEIVASAKARAGELGLAPGARVLIAGDRPRPLDWLLTPMAAHGSVVMCRNAEGVDLDARAASERAVRLDLG